MKVLKFLIVFFIIFILGILLFKYYDTDNEVKLLIGNEEIILRENDKNNVIELDSLSNEKKITIKSIRNMESIILNSKRLLYKKKIKMDINKENKINLKIKFKKSKKYTNYVINLLPQDFPEFTVKGKSITNKDYYLTSFSTKSNYIYKLNNKGDIVFYKKTNYLSYIFKKDIINKKVYYSYLDTDESVDIRSFKINILDENYNLVKKISLKDNLVMIDPHDYVLIDLNHYIFAYSTGSEDKITIEEQKDGKTIWEYSFDKYSSDYNYDGTIHFNSFKLDGKYLLISFRDTSEILKIDRTNGEIKWILNGNNNMFDKEIFKNQHSIEKYNNSYIVYSNNCALSIIDEAKDNESDLKSSIVKFEIDEKNNKIINYKEYKLPVLSGVHASVQPINKSTYVISYGVFNNKKYHDMPNFEEINIETGESYFSFKYINDGFVYRVYQF